MPKHSHGKNIEKYTSSTRKIQNAADPLFHRIVDTGLLFRRLNITANHVMSERKVPEVDASEQMDLFSPFTALTGYDAVLQEAGRLTTLQKELDEGVQEELDKQLRVLAGLLDQHPAVTVTWFRPDGKKEGGNYLIATGAVRKIDAYREVMILQGGEQIPFRDLLSLSGECLPDNE